MAASRRGWLALAAGIAIVLAASSAFWPFTIDDTYITARYAENLAAGHGPVFTVGERVEGYSCPSWVGALALVAGAGGDPVSAAKAMGVVAAVLLVVVMFFALRRAGLAPALVAAGTLWTAALTGIGVYAPSGMETVPFGLAVLLIAALPLLELSCTWRAVLCALSIVLVATLRPEGAPLAIGAGALWLATDRTRRVKLAVAGALGVLVVLLVVRVTYYGSWLPNTYLAKPSVLLAEAAAAGPLAGAARVAWTILAGSGPRALVAAAGGPVVLFLVALAIARGGRDVRLRPAVLALLVGWAFVAYAPHDWMPAGRFALPFAPVLILLAILGAARLGVERSKAVRSALAVVTLAWIGWQAASLAEIRRTYTDGRANPALDARAFAPIGEWLALHAAPGELVLAYEVGAVGYLSGCGIIDHEGLVTRDVAEVIHDAGGYTKIRFGGAPDALRRIVELCVARRPEWFLVRSSKPFPAPPGRPLPRGAANEPVQNALLDAFGGTMVLRASFDLPAPPGVDERYLLLGRAAP